VEHLAAKERRAIVARISRDNLSNGAGKKVLKIISDRPRPEFMPHSDRASKYPLLGKILNEAAKNPLMTQSALRVWRFLGRVRLQKIPNFGSKSLCGIRLGHEARSFDEIGLHGRRQALARRINY
jgi:hypothetical protein